uniref:Uncharacterized protein n=1 Tax=Meloidogyne enterolobii TaxID=390850 RepID=A0A6V7UJ98_MELEN|nr:unnamed protein product [Meloidogyne enterolobii]
MNNTNNNLLSPIQVVAKYKFEGRNNDELSFSKNDIITVTQQLDGGWWEGSLDGRVGWFPTDFVNLIKNCDDQQNAKKSVKTTKNRLEIDLSKLEISKASFRVQLVQEFLIKENSKLEIIERTLDTIKFLMKEVKEFSSDDLFNFSISKLTEFINFKKNFFKRFEEELRKPITNQYIGDLLLNVAPGLSSILRCYCEKYCDLLEKINTQSVKVSKLLENGKMDLKSLILGLSLVFRHVQKYSSTLQEIERNTLENHPDRGNLQRAALFYSDLLEDCEMLRKQREAQLDFLQTKFFEEKFGGKNNYESSKLGKLLYIGKVSLSLEGGNNKNNLEEKERINSPVELDRTIVIFSNNILLLDMQTTSGQYSLCYNFPIIDLNITQLTDVRNTLQLFKKGENLFTLQCFSSKDFVNLLNSLRSINIKIITTTSSTTNTTKNAHQTLRTRNNFEENGRKIEKGNKQHNNNDHQQQQQNLIYSNNNLKINHQLEMIYPDGIDDVDNNVNDENFNNNKRYTSGLSTSENLSNNGGCFSGSSVCGNRESRPFSGLSLRPLPPRRSEWFSNNNNTSQQIKLRKGLTPEEQEDALLLKIVEGYCLSSNCLATSSINNHQHKQQQQCCPHYYRQKQRNSAESQHNYNSCGGGPIRRAASYPDKNEMATTTLTRPQLIVAENEKIFVEEMEGDQIVLKERSLVDTVYTLKDNLSALTKQVVELSKSLEQEQRSRRRLEELVRQTIPSTTSTSLIDQQTQQLEAS